MAKKRTNAQSKKKRSSKSQRKKRTTQNIKRKASHRTQKKSETFEVGLTFRQHERYVNSISSHDLKELRGSGIPIKGGLRLSEFEFSMGGDREVSIDLDFIQASVGAKELPIVFPKTKKPKKTISYKGKTVIYGCASTNHCLWTANVKAASVEDIRVECEFSERWILPNGLHADIYTVFVRGDNEADLVFENGGMGTEEAWVYHANGKVIGLSEDTDESGTAVLRID